MPSLAELQQQMAAAVLHDAVSPELEEVIAPGIISTAEGLRIHRNTVLGSLSHALQLSCPTAAKLLGEVRFDAAVVAYARESPPASADLCAYGAGFAEFLRNNEQMSGLPGLGEIARFDRALEQTAQATSGPGVSVVLEGSVRLTLCASVRLFTCRGPVEEVREAIASGSTPWLNESDWNTEARTLALWLSEQGVGVRPLSATAARFIEAVLDGAPVEHALEAAAAGEDSAATIVSVETEVLRAGFVTLSSED